MATDRRDLPPFYERLENARLREMAESASDARMRDGLPLDAREAPFTEKFLRGRHLFASWFEFGRTADGRFCDLSDSDGDVLTGLTPAQAERLIEVRDRFLNEALAILNGPDERDERDEAER